MSLEGIVAGADPERGLVLAYAGRARRGGLAALFALDVTLGQVVASTTEPMIGALRLAWWREALERLHQQPTPAEPVLAALAAGVVRGDATVAARLAAMTDGWLALIEADPLDELAVQTHAEARGGGLFGLAALVLSGEEAAGMARLGRGWALVDLASRLSQDAARSIALAGARAALRVGAGPSPRPLRPLLALAALARRDAESGLAGRRPGAPGRQVRMMVALLAGR